MKIATVVGARPNFIKAAVVSRELRQAHDEIIVHTGQHFDHNMSKVFFNELGIPKPDYNLGIAGGTHGQMTGAMIAAIEEVLMKENPDTVLVYGDTNSTLAGALAAVKLLIPVCHVEAGPRLGTLTNPEEVNRICTDHVSSLLMCCFPSSMEHLKNEGLADRAVFTGDPMYDAFCYYGERLPADVLAKVEGLDGNPVDIPDRYYYLTCHRQENTATDEPLREIFTAMEQLDAPAIYPVHPRNRERAGRLCKQYGFSKTLLIKPVGYMASIALVKGSQKVVTDSGGVQREAFFAGKQCIMILDFISLPEIMVGNANQLAKPRAKDILTKLSAAVTWSPEYKPFGDGHSARLITKAITERKLYETI